MKFLFFISSLLLTQLIFGQEDIWIKPNRGQWHTNIEYKINIPSGEMYLENGGFTYSFTNQKDIHNHHEDKHENEFEGHVIKTSFINSNHNPEFIEIDSSDHYDNYFLGQDQSKWANHVYSFKAITYKALYNGINLNLYQKNSSLKYDIIIKPHTDPSIFKVKYEGQDKIRIQKQELIITTQLGTITEKKPFAYQLINGVKKRVDCNYILQEDVMSFEFPDGYDSTKTLIIDPELAFSSFTGSTSDNWGMTACPDINGNLIAAGIVFGSGYPVTSGAYDASYLSGGSNTTVDIGLTKFSEDGSSLMYSTYIGGSGSETPHSIIVNQQNELYIMGATSSTNFPVSNTAYQQSHNGGPAFMTIDGINFNGGSDIFIFKLSANGSNLLASTYLGGSAADGISDGNSNIHYNYGDQLRGEIIVDNSSNVFITSTTKSNNFPIVGGFDSSLGGQQDAVVAKLTSNLTTLSWSTYLGGTSWESGNSLQLASNGDIYSVGGTTSNNFPSTTGQLNSSFKGGSTDGYITKFTAPFYNNPKSSYLGTTGYDQAYFVQLDIDDKVYVYGQTNGNYPISAAQYSNSNSGQFIHKLNSNLTTTEWSSLFGSSSGEVEISPTAFLVSDCYEIYIAGWGGTTNQNNSSGNATSSSTNGLPVTPDAYQSQTNGSNFYLALFTADMLSLKYATFMGSLTGNGDHVDGGTSRFSKSGKVYHAVCAACGGNANGFPTTPGVASTTNNSNNCNMAAFLFELSKIEATLSTGTPVTCIPDPTFFENDSENGDTYEWIFGDGATSSDFEPSHEYTIPGTYTVLLIVSDGSGCYEPDTAYVEVIIIEPIYEVWALSDTICPGETVQVFATGGTGFAWGPPELFDDPSSASPFVTINQETELTVEIFSECGGSTLNITIFVYGTDAESGLDTAICVTQSVELTATGGASYHWSPESTLTDPDISNPIATPHLTTYYQVEIITPEGCHIFDSTKVQVDHNIPYPNLIDQVSICLGDSIQIIANGATDYIWTPDINISSTTLYNPFVNPIDDISYAITFINACGKNYDTVDVKVIKIIGSIITDTIICPGDTAIIWASGGEQYDWFPNVHLNSPNDSVTNAFPTNSMDYYCEITDEFGCSSVLSTYIDLFNEPTVTTSPTVYGFVGDTTLISADGIGTIQWSPPLYINCIHCADALVSPPNNFVYTATLTDANTCKVSQDVLINYDPLIFVPNTFTPDGDEFNNSFFAVAHNVTEFHMLIFNRWGEIIFESNSIDQHWSGHYKGRQALDDVYVWKINYSDLNGINYELVGHVTLLR
jgi:gliding motility-associated-like protein